MEKSKLIKKLEACSNCKTCSEREKRLQAYIKDEKFYKLISNICMNASKGNIPLSKKEKAILKAEKTTLKDLSKRKIRPENVPQTGSGILSILLPLALPILTSMLGTDNK
jgi:hypothetical protein